jgi:hypothetical protein
LTLSPRPPHDDACLFQQFCSNLKFRKSSPKEEEEEDDDDDDDDEEQGEQESLREEFFEENDYLDWVFCNCSNSFLATK